MFPMNIVGIETRYGKVEEAVIDLCFSDIDPVVYSDKKEIVFLLPKSDDLLERLIGYLEQNAARVFFFSLFAPAHLRKLQGGEALKALSVILLASNGVKDADIASLSGLKEEEVSSLVHAIKERHDDLETYFEHIGIEETDYRYIANMLGKQEISAGAVLFSPRGKVLVEHMGFGHYSIPKGHVEAIDSDLVETAKREIKEELGLDAEILSSHRTSIFYSPKDGAVKEVVFFLGQAKEGELTLQKEEVQDAYWLDPQDAYRTLSFNSDRKVLETLYREYKKL